MSATFDPFASFDEEIPSASVSTNENLENNPETDTKNLETTTEKENVPPVTNPRGNSPEVIEIRSSSSETEKSIFDDGHREISTNNSNVRKISPQLLQNGQINHSLSSKYANHLHDRYRNIQQIQQIRAQMLNQANQQQMYNTGKYLFSVVPAKVAIKSPKFSKEDKESAEKVSESNNVKTVETGKSGKSRESSGTASISSIESTEKTEQPKKKIKSTKKIGKKSSSKFDPIPLAAVRLPTNRDIALPNDFRRGDDDFQENFSSFDFLGAQPTQSNIFQRNYQPGPNHRNWYSSQLYVGRGSVPNNIRMDQQGRMVPPNNLQPPMNVNPFDLQQRIASQQNIQSQQLLQNFTKQQLFDECQKLNDKLHHLQRDYANKEKINERFQSIIANLEQSIDNETAKYKQACEDRDEYKSRYKTEIDKSRDLVDENSDLKIKATNAVREFEELKGRYSSLKIEQTTIAEQKVIIRQLEAKNKETDEYSEGGTRKFAIKLLKKLNSKNADPEFTRRNIHVRKMLRDLDGDHSLLDDLAVQKVAGVFKNFVDKYDILYTKYKTDSKTKEQVMEQFAVDKKLWHEKEKNLQQELASLRKKLNRQAYYQASKPPNAGSYNLHPKSSPTKNEYVTSQSQQQANTYSDNDRGLSSAVSESDIDIEKPNAEVELAAKAELALKSVNAYRVSPLPDAGSTNSKTKNIKAKKEFLGSSRPSPIKTRRSTRLKEKEAAAEQIPKSSQRDVEKQAQNLDQMIFGEEEPAIDIPVVTKKSVTAEVLGKRPELKMKIKLNKNQLNSPLRPKPIEPTPKSRMATEPVIHENSNMTDVSSPKRRVAHKPIEFQSTKKSNSIEDTIEENTTKKIVTESKNENLEKMFDFSDSEADKTETETKNDNSAPYSGPNLPVKRTQKPSISESVSSVSSFRKQSSFNVDDLEMSMSESEAESGAEEDHTLNKIEAGQSIFDIPQIKKPLIIQREPIKSKRLNLGKSPLSSAETTFQRPNLPKPKTDNITSTSQKQPAVRKSSRLLDNLTQNHGGFVNFQNAKTEFLINCFIFERLLCKNDKKIKKYYNLARDFERNLWRFNNHGTQEGLQKVQAQKDLFWLNLHAKIAKRESYVTLPSKILNQTTVEYPCLSAYPKKLDDPKSWKPYGLKDICLDSSSEEEDDDIAENETREEYLNQLDANRFKERETVSDSDNSDEYEDIDIDAFTNNPAKDTIQAGVIELVRASASPIKKSTSIILPTVNISKNLENYENIAANKPKKLLSKRRRERSGKSIQNKKRKLESFDSSDSEAEMVDEKSYETLLPKAKGIDSGNSSSVESDKSDDEFPDIDIDQVLKTEEMENLQSEKNKETKIILAFSAKPKKPKVVIQKKTIDNKSTVSENSKTTEKIETSTKNSLKKSKPVQINYLQILSQQNHQKLFNLSTIEYRLFKAQVKILVTNIKDNLDYSNVILDRNQFVLNMEPDEEVLLAKIISKNLNYTNSNEVQNCLTDKNYGIYNVIWNQVIMEVANQEESFFPDNQSRSKNVGKGHVQFYKKRLWMVCAGFRMICLIANLVVDRICRKSAAADDQEVKKIVQAIKFDIGVGYSF